SGWVNSTSVWFTAASSLPSSSASAQRSPCAARCARRAATFSKEPSSVRLSVLTSSRTWAKKSTLIMAFHLKITGFAAAFCQQTHRANHHIFLYRFTHVVDGQRRHGGRRQRLHLHAGFPG